MLATASISVPSTLKCSSDSSPRRSRLPHHLVEQGLACPVFQQSFPVLGEHRGVEATLHKFHVQELAEQQIVFQLLAEGSLAAHRVKGDEQGGLTPW